MPEPHINYLRAIQPDSSFRLSASLLAIAGIVCAALLITSCKSAAPLITYEPVATLSVEESKRVIHRSLEEQPPGYAAANIEITDEKLSYSRDVVRRIVVIPTTTESRHTVFYFDSLGKMDITPKAKGDVVRVWDANGVFRFRAVIPDPDRARRFMDALLTMSLHAKDQL